MAMQTQHYILRTSIEILSLGAVFFVLSKLEFGYCKLQALVYSFEATDARARHLFELLLKD